MIRIYCDVCGNEIDRTEAGKRLCTTWKNVETRVLVAVDGVWNSGHICKACLFAALNEGDAEYKNL